MLNSFIDYIETEGLVYPGQKVLLGVSGGVDSMVMAHLFREAGIEHAYAHCNFMLRGKESHRDESIVRQYAHDLSIPFFSRRFNTTDFAREHGVSIQMAARHLRLRWFEKLLYDYSYDLIATAHHKDDQVETFFLNLMRATGIAGLHGILPKRGSLIHPMLFADRSQILSYAHRLTIPYANDSSNDETRYSRNKIRHVILPALEEITPGFSQIITKNIKRLRETEAIYKQSVHKTLSKLETTKDHSPAIPIDKLMALEYPTTFLFEYLSQFQFKYNTVEDIINSLEGIPGKTFYSSTHWVYRDREYLVVRKKLKHKEKRPLVLHEKDIPGYKDQPIRMCFKWIKKDKNFYLSPNPSIAYIDADKLEFPLRLSLWEHGESFQPLGMRKFKKISDFLIDEKVPLYVKEDVYLLRSGSNVVWIAGMRPDNRYRISRNTRNILKCILLTQ